VEQRRKVGPSDLHQLALEPAQQSGTFVSEAHRADLEGGTAERDPLPSHQLSGLAVGGHDRPHFLNGVVVDALFQDIGQGHFVHGAFLQDGGSPS
jgi:hypothetical protein